MLNSGDVILAKMQFADSFGIKIRPCVVLFEECDNIVVAGITSNTNRLGIPLTRNEGAIKESVIKTNYLFTISTVMIEKMLFSLTKEKRNIVFEDLTKKLEKLIC